MPVHHNQPNSHMNAPAVTRVTRQRCHICHSEEIEEVLLEGETPPVKSEVAHAEIVLAVLKEQGLTIGKFLLAVLGDVENLSCSAKKK